MDQTKELPIVELESDYLDVVQTILSTLPMISNFGQIIEESRRNIRNLSKVSLHFIKRFIKRSAN